MGNIAIIGAGQIGSRHLQSFAQMRGETKIYVVDPNPNSIKVAEQRFIEVAIHPSKINVEYLDEIKKLPKCLDVAIISTNSDVRRQVIEELFDWSSVKNLILEKVVFQRIDDFSVIDKLFKKQNVKVWVNCPRRMWKAYKEIKMLLMNENLIQLNISGSQWGLACNSIHLIDLIGYLTNTVQYSIRHVDFDDDIHKSKRKGFYEFTGSFGGIFAENIKFNISSFSKGNIPLTINIITDKSIFICLEVDSELQLLHANSINKWQLPIKKFIIPYQSQLTHIVVKHILNNGICDLTTYKDSLKFHIPLLECFIKYVSRIENRKVEICPIT